MNKETFFIVYAIHRTEYAVQIDASSKEQARTLFYKIYDKDCKITEILTVNDISDNFANKLLTN